MSHKKIDAEIKVKWTEALRSGRYTQTQRCLRDDTGYCCLGVLCDLHDSAAWQAEYGGYEYVQPTKDGGTISMEDNLPSVLRERYGIDPSTEAMLIELNDINGRSFEEIADFIDKEL